MAPRPHRAWQSAAKAKPKSKELGELRAFEPASRRSDGAPKVGPGPGYVVTSGNVYQPAWCNSVGNVWDENPKRVLVVEEISAGPGKVRTACDEPMQVVGPG